MAEEKSVKKKISKARVQILEYKNNCEAMIVSTIYSKPSLLYEIDLTIDDFSSNIWKVYYSIAHGVVVKEKVEDLNEVTVGMFLDKHSKLKAKFDEYGGYQTIKIASEYGTENSIQGYIHDFRKWQSVLKLEERGFPIEDRLSDFADMTLEEIYNEQEMLLNDTFVRVDTSIKTYNACDGIYDLIESMDKGDEIGLPLYNSKFLNEEIGGLNLGHIYGVGANSGIGKSTTVLNVVMPSVLEHDEQMAIFINEEDERKVRKELLIWVANNIFSFNIQKKDLRKGNFSEELKNNLKVCAKWIEEKKNNRNITIVPLESYSANTVIKLIKKYASMGVKYFVLDTLKESCDTMSVETYKALTRDMVRFYDVVKPKAKNVCLVVTYQLGKSSIKMRYLTNNEIGLGKGIVDVMSVNLMMRRPFDDEYEDGRFAIEYYVFENNGKTKVSRKLKRENNYMIFFIPKNRFGSSDAFQIVAEFDLSKNKFKDIGMCNVMQDY